MNVLLSQMLEENLCRILRFVHRGDSVANVRIQGCQYGGKKPGGGVWSGRIGFAAKREDQVSVRRCGMSVARSDNDGRDIAVGYINSKE